MKPNWKIKTLVHGLVLAVAVPLTGAIALLVFSGIEREHAAALAAAALLGVAPLAFFLVRRITRSIELARETGLARESAHREIEQRFRQVAENIREVFYLVDPASNQLLYISPGYEHVWGRKPEELYASPQEWMQAIHPGDRQRVVDGVSNEATGSYDEEYRILRPDGELRWIHDRAVPVRDAEGNIYRVAGIAEDITERKRIEGEASAAGKRLESILTSITDGFYAIDADWRFTYLNPRAEQLLRRTSGELLGRGIWEEFPEAVGSAVELNARIAVSSQKAVHYEEYYPPFESWFEIHVYPYEGGLSVFFQDITERKRQEKELSFLAQYDALTQLPNRSLFRDRLQQAMARARRGGGDMALMFLDLDRFKEINDSLGHAIGDKVLQGVAERFREHVREADTIARLGGDEFTIIAEGLQRPEHAAAIAAKIQAALAEPLVIDGNEIYVTASIGAVLYPQQPDDIEGLLKKADIAMYQAKRDGGHAFQLYSGARARPSEQPGLEAKLRRALERGELALHYQPLVEAAGSRIVGAEALLRWNNPELGLIPPARFIPLAEETGLILEIGDWVMRSAAEQNRAWQRMGHAPIRVAVNLSARQFRQKGIAEKAARLLAETGLEARYLELEITESVIMHHTEATLATLHEINRMGIGLSIDDFGTGYSSLAYLKRFPVQSIKIDRAFIRDAASSAADGAILSAIVALAGALGLHTVAEGVETAEQLAALRLLGVQQYQGYYFSKPLPAEEFERLLEREGGRAGSGGEQPRLAAA
jgi:diguanylate cyclase (GGDEF)-like protein/PAS domain S-box-containing protein